MNQLCVIIKSVNNRFHRLFTVLIITHNWFILIITVKRKGIPLSADFVVPFYMFFIGLMMVDLRPKHVALMWTYIAYFYHFVDILLYFRR